MSEEVKDLETTENIHRDSKGRNLSWQWTKKRTSSSLSFSVGRTFIVLSWLSMRRTQKKEGRKQSDRHRMTVKSVVTRRLTRRLTEVARDLSDSQDCESCSCIRTSGETKIHWQSRWFSLSLLLLFLTRMKNRGNKKNEDKVKETHMKCTGVPL